MIMKTEVVEIVNKTRLIGANQRGEYNLPQIIIRGGDNVLINLILPNEFLYEKTDIGDKVKVNYYIDIRGKISINDIEKVK